MSVNITALETYLAPLYAYFNEDGVNEISINHPQEIWIEKYGEMRCEQVPAFDFEHLRALGRLVAQSTEQFVSEETPLLSANLPSGFRIQVVFPPVCEPGTVAMSIRKQTILNFDLDQYEAIGAFQSTAVKQEANPIDAELRRLLNTGEIKSFIKTAVRARKNVIISGGTSTGKTTFMNAALKEIPGEERIITCEDAREIMLSHIPNRVHLIASKGGQGRANVSIQHLIEACLRLRPDRIIVGELRGAEAFSYLRAVNTGHPGSIATLHADSPALAFEQLILMVLQAGLGISRDQIEQYVRSIVDVVVQLKRGQKGMRYVSEIHFQERTK
ncbi:P-type DNA transfer ATPase VirB11 [bacterium]|nr:P-type DNA transfer ATPase VirB11 [bacterium]